MYDRSLVTMGAQGVDHIARAIQYVKKERSRALTMGKKLDILMAQAKLRQQGHPGASRTIAAMLGRMLTIVQGV